MRTHTRKCNSIEFVSEFEIVDLCEEDVTTRAVITQLQNVEAKKRKPGGFGVRDSRRQSRRYERREREEEKERRG